MLIGNKLYKQRTSGEITQLTTDDIPEGEYNKYCLQYADGKIIGDIVLRFSPEEISCHKRLNGQTIYEYEAKSFYTWCNENKTLATSDTNYDFFNKTETEYTTFLNDNTWQETGENYCPYFVISTASITVYTVQKGELTGYTPLAGVEAEEVASGYIYDTVTLTSTIDECAGWYYTGASTSSTINCVKLPTIPSYFNGDTKVFPFIIVNSRVDDDTTSIRSVTVGSTETLSYDQDAYVTNVGTMQNLVLNFGVPSGVAATIQVNNVSEGDVASVVNVGDAHDALLDFVIPRGPQGIAGGVVDLTDIVDQLPDTGSLNEKIYNTADNTVYIYNGSAWEEYQEANAGLIYTCNSLVYYFNGSTLNETYAQSQPDNLTISNNSTDALQAIGLISASDASALKVWVGTLASWEQGRADGTIPDNFICFITDDGN